MPILVPLCMITIMLKRCGASVFRLRHENKYKNAINVDIWVFVCMVSFMLGQVEHETRIFLFFFFFCLIGWVLCAVCGKLRLVLCFWCKPWSGCRVCRLVSYILQL